MFNIIRNLAVAGLLVAFIAIGGAAADTPPDQLTFAGIFTDNAVLQRDTAVPIWGWGKPGEQVTVTFAEQTKTATVDAAGKWRIELEPLPAAVIGRTLRVQSADARRHAELRDILVGDVWLCSGQSNMHFRMTGVENAATEIAAAKHQAIRCFTVKDQFGQQPADNLEGEWQPLTPQTIGTCSAVAYYFGRDLHQRLNVPIGLIISSIGGTRIETWSRREILVANNQAQWLFEKWNAVSPAEFSAIEEAYRRYQHQRDHIHPQAVRAAKAQGVAPPPEPPRPKLRCHDCPCALHNGMIAPLQPYAIRGAVWYQGESNAGQAAAYEILLPALIADWRKVWGAKLPFLFVQLAPHRTIHPAIRLAQLRVWQRTAHTAMVVTTDVGDATNIHPIRKRPVGERLALAARALSYGEAIEYSGPIFKSMAVEKNQAVVSFAHQGTGLVAKGGDLRGFTIAGADGKFVPAQAVIRDDVVVVVTADQVSQPTAVRYGWNTVPDVNLYNREGLPASPFRSDATAKTD